MKILVLSFLLISLKCWGYTDSDLDGVEDGIDQCPQTPFSDLVDQDGCPLNTNRPTLHYDLIMGIGYSQLNYTTQTVSDTFSSLIQADIYRNGWWLQLLASRFQSTSAGMTQSGMDDTLLTLYYRFNPSEAFSFHTGAGLLFPTYRTGYSNEAIDYAFSFDFQYTLTSNTYLFGGYGYTFVNDRDVSLLRYQNSDTFHAGIGTDLTSYLGSELTYHRTKSMYQENEPYTDIGFTTLFQIDPHWFTTLAYQYGLNRSASNHTLTLRLGYYF